MANELTYIIVRRVNGAAGIFCRICGMVSWHPQDVEFLFCGNCKKFHRDMQAEDAISTRPQTLVDRVQAFMGRH